MIVRWGWSAPMLAFSLAFAMGCHQQGPTFDGVEFTQCAGTSAALGAALLADLKPLTYLTCSYMDAVGSTEPAIWCDVKGRPLDVFEFQFAHQHSGEMCVEGVYTAGGALWRRSLPAHEIFR
jgi:hypothetical protein